MGNRKEICREKYEKSGGNYEIEVVEKHLWEKNHKPQVYTQLSCILSSMLYQGEDAVDE